MNVHFEHTLAKDALIGGPYVFKIRFYYYFFFSFNHQNVNSKCNNDAQMWEAFVWICTFEKKKQNKQNHPTGLFPEQQQRVGESSRSSSQNTTCFHLCHTAPPCSTVCRPKLSPRWRFWQINPVPFLLLLFLFFQRVRYTLAPRPGTCIFVQIYTLYPR